MDNIPSQFRNTKSRSAEQSFNLPEELIEEILSRLVVKSLLRFRCVSKSWRSLIGSEQFIETHFQNSRKNKSLAHHRVIFNWNRPRVMKQCSLHSLLNKPSIDPIDIQSKRCRVVGCCNGLFCLLNLEGSFFLWNPATKISIELPKIDHVPPKYGFGWDEMSGAYKVFAAVVTNPNQLRGRVYSTKTNSWKTVECGRFPWRCETGKFACGNIHWLVTRGQYIESFDLEGEEFGRIELPFNEEGEGWVPSCLGEFGGCLRVMYDYRHVHSKQSRVDVWIMKEYGVKESWLKLVTLPLVYEPKFFPLAPLLGRGPNGEILLIYRGTFSVYYPKYDVFWTAKNMINFFEAHVYVESLVSPVRMLEKFVEGGDSR